MKLYLEINNQIYRLGQFHKRQCTKKFTEIQQLIDHYLTNKYKYRCLNNNDVKIASYSSANNKIILSCHSDDYQIETNKSLLQLDNTKLKKLLLKLKDGDYQS